ncbi:hypothetical protein Tco_1260415 [Tanacetum coccineum]
MDDYVIDDQNMGSAMNEDEEKMMDELMWAQVYEFKHPITYINDKEGNLAANASTMDVVMNDTNEYTPLVGFDVAEIDVSKAQVEDATVEDSQVDGGDVDEVVACWIMVVG